MKKPIMMALSMLALGALACNLPLPGNGGRSAAVPEPTPNPGAVQILLDEGVSIERAFEQVQGLQAGAQFEVTITEAELARQINQMVTSDPGAAEALGYVDIGLNPGGTLSISVPVDASFAGFNSGSVAFIAFDVDVVEGVISVTTLESYIEAAGIKVALPERLVSELNDAVETALMDLRSGWDDSVRLDDIVIYGGGMRISGTAVN